MREDIIREIESLLRSATNSRQEMKLKMRGGVDLFRRLYDVSLAREVVLNQFMGGDTISYDTVIDRLKIIKGHPILPESANEPDKFEERRQGAIEDLIKHFENKKAQDSK